MKRVLSLVCIVSLMMCMMVGLSGCGSQDSVEVKAKIGVLLYDGADAYQPMIETYQSSLNSRYQKGEIVYVEKNAGGDAEKLKTCIKELVEDEKVNAIVAFGDEASVAAVEQKLSVPVFFVGVTDAVALGLTGDLDAPDKNATGAQISAPVEKLLVEIPKLTEVSSYGILYNANDAASAYAAKLMETALSEAGISSQSTGVGSEDEAVSAAASLAGGNDALFVTNDAMMEGAMEKIVGAADAKSKPVFAYSQTAVEKGAVLAVGIMTGELAGMVGQSTYDVLSGKSIAQIPVVRTTGGQQVYINQRKAVQLGYTLNDEFLNTAMLIDKVETPTTEAPAEEEAE